jgi:hypothetical protein
MSHVVKVLTSALVEEARKHAKATALIERYKRGGDETARNQRTIAILENASAWLQDENAKVNRALYTALQQAQRNAEDAEKLKAEVDRLTVLNNNLFNTLNLLLPETDYAPGSYNVNFRKAGQIAVSRDVHEAMFGKTQHEAVFGEVKGYTAPGEVHGIAAPVVAQSE